MPLNEKYDFRSYIKDIFIEVPNYNYNHRPHSGIKDDKKQGKAKHHFIGRTKLQASFRDILKKGDRNGAYLVTGYRGMGKTSLVNHVVHAYKDEKKGDNVTPVKISLAQAKLDELDVLKHILKVLLDQVAADRRSWLFPILEYSAVLFAGIALCIGYFFRDRLIPGQLPKGDDALNLSLLGFFLTFVALIFIVAHNASQFLISAFAQVKSILRSGVLGFLRILMIPAVAVSAVVVVGSSEKFARLWCDFHGNYLRRLPETWMEIATVAFIALCCIVIFYYLFNFNRLNKLYGLYNRLNILYERSHSNITTEGGGTGFLKDISFSFTGRRSRSYPIAQAKEIEYELIEILKAYTYRKFIFIFDELDKVEMDVEFNKENYGESERTFLNDLRERKQIIIKVLSSLKHLLTEASARFIFIAGREMFDASLADISDRQSALGSIFHHTIYVESFLKETKLVNHAENTSSNNLVEEYLDHILLTNLTVGNWINQCRRKVTRAWRRMVSLFQKGNKRSKPQSQPILSVVNWIKQCSRRIIRTCSGVVTRLQKGNKRSKPQSQPFLFRYWNFLQAAKEGKEFTKPNNDGQQPTVQDEHLVKILFTLQNFVTYLSYRSNGSPKKLIKLIEENFVQGSSIIGWEKAGRGVQILENDMHVIVCSTDTKFEDKVFLNLSYRQQYKLGLNAYLFFPFLSLQKNLLENYSDSVNVSTPYLMDSIIKFHPFAFSNHNLELLPELLSTNKAPELRYFVQELIDFLGKNHIRETDSGLFKYKFFDRTHNEIAYISRISDEESAAFNFSMDESFAIKNHIAYKIQFLRNVFKDFKKSNTSSVESILFLNDLLGDSQLFDEYYKDAIISLTDALHDVPLPNRSTPIESFLIWMRIKLKLSMVFDKMRYYEMAVGHLGLAMEVSLNYLAERYLPDSSEEIKKVRKFEKPGRLHVVIHKNDESETESPARMTTPLYRELLQVTQHAILGSIYVQEKFAEGLTYAKMNSYLGQYAKIHEHSAFRTYQGRDMMMASFYLGLGTVLYFKNKTLPLNKTQKISEAYKRMTLDLSKKDFPDDDVKQEYQAGVEQTFLSQATHIIGDTPVFKIGDGTVKVSSELSFYSYIMPSYAELYVSFRTFEEASSERSDFRFSFITYIAYKKSLATFLAADLKTQSDSRGEKDATMQSILAGPYSLQSLIVKAVDIVKDYKNVHGSRKMVSLANVITKLADHLLALYVPPKNSDEGRSGPTTSGTHDADKKPEYMRVFADVISKYNEQDRKVNCSGEQFLDDLIFGGKLGGEGFAGKWNHSRIQLTYLLSLYYLAGRLYAKGGRNVAYGFQLKKILMSIRTTGVLSTFQQSDFEHLIPFLEKTFVKKILQLNSMANGSSDRAQIAAMKYFTQIPNIALPPDLTGLYYQNLASNPDAKEALIIFNEIKLYAIEAKLSAADSFKKATDQIRSLKLIGQFNSISHQAVRIMELNLQVNINKILLEKVISPKLAYKSPDDGSGNGAEEVTISSVNGKSWVNSLHAYSFRLKFEALPDIEFYKSDPEIMDTALFERFVLHIACKEKLEEDNPFCDAFESYTQLVTNSIFCLYQCTLTCNMYGVNYMQGPAYLAGFYKRMGDWIKHLNLCRIIGKYLRTSEVKRPLNLNEKRNLRTIDGMEQSLEKLVGRTAIRHIDDCLSHYQNAIERYNDSIQLHSEGPAYKHQLNNMIYLEDDYGDNLNHFGAAIERQMINSGKIRRRIVALEEEMKISRLFNADNYYSPVSQQ